MSKQRLRASEVWEVPCRGGTLDGSGTLRARLNPSNPTEVELAVKFNANDNERSMVILSAAEWRALCDLRNVIRPARAKRNTP